MITRAPMMLLNTSTVTMKYNHILLFIFIELASTIYTVCRLYGTPRLVQSSP